MIEFLSLNMTFGVSFEELKDNDPVTYEIVKVRGDGYSNTRCKPTHLPILFPSSLFRTSLITNVFHAKMFTLFIIGD